MSSSLFYLRTYFSQIFKYMLSCDFQSTEIYNFLFNSSFNGRIAKVSTTLESRNKEIQKTAILLKLRQQKFEFVKECRNTQNMSKSFKGFCNPAGCTTCFLNFNHNHLVTLQQISQLNCYVHTCLRSWRSEFLKFVMRTMR